MPVRPVDLRGALLVDAAKGNLRSRDDRPLLAVPLEGLSHALTEGGPSAVRALGVALGAALEGPAREALSDVEHASPSDFAYAINAGLARFGLGRVAFEQWGAALVVRWSDAPATKGVLAELSAYALVHCLKALFGLEASAAVLASKGSVLSLLVSNEAVCAYARSKPEASIADIVADLHSEETT